MSAVLLTGPTDRQNSPFLSQHWLQQSPVLTTSSHKGMARLSCPRRLGWYTHEWSPVSVENHPASAESNFVNEPNNEVRNFISLPSPFPPPPFPYSSPLPFHFQGLFPHIHRTHKGLESTAFPLWAPPVWSGPPPISGDSGSKNKHMRPL